MNEGMLLFWYFFVIGACIGSFLNVCIVRLPLEKSVVFPGSHCPKCKKEISWYNNIPLLSYLFLRGKCRYCNQSISPCYFFVELLTGLSFAGFYYYYGLNWLLLPYLMMYCGFIVATFVDFEHRIIPDEVSVGGMFVGWALSAVVVSMHQLSIQELHIGRMMMLGIIGIAVIANVLDSIIHKKSFMNDDFLLFKYFCVFVLIDCGYNYLLPNISGVVGSTVYAHITSFYASMIGIVVGGGCIYIMGILGDVIFRKESMGGGDVKLMAMVGAFLGWKLAILSFFIAPFFGSIYGVAEKIRTGDTAIAYGPFLVAGSLISLFYGDRIIDIILYGYF